MKGRYVETRWQGRPLRAWLPSPLSEQTFDLSARTVRRTERARAAVVRANDLTAGQLRHLASLLLRSDGIASSFIEGIEASAEAVAAASLGAAPDLASASVAANLRAVREALADVDRPLELTALHAWHRRLMARGSLLPERMIGSLRDRQGWIGGDIPTRAAFVPPPPEHVSALVDDLIDFANSEELDPITQAAVLHAQFEVIHPYGDGNGRIGRLLIEWVLARRLRVTVPPPVSVFMARDISGYRAGLTRVSDGSTEEWVDWVAGIIERASEASLQMARTVAAIGESWGQMMSGLHRDGLARRLTDLLLVSPVLAADIAARELGVSERAARLALHQLEGRGIIAPCPGLPSPSPGRPRRWWSAKALLDLVDSWGARSQPPEVDG